jgi:hypothetical protein
MPDENPRLDAALAYAERGWKVFPIWHVRDSENIPCACGQGNCTQIGKHPRTPNGLLDSTDDPELIRAWWKSWPKANVGILTGEESGIVVVDEDPRHGGDATMKGLTDAYGQPPDTVSTVTGGSGQHYVFKHPGRPIQNDSLGKKLGLGLDIRGDGGYIIAPPSNHKSGNVYGWKSGFSPDDIDPAPLPPWLLSMMVEEPEPKTKKRIVVSTPTTTDTGSYWLGKALSQAAPGNRNAVGFNLACQLRDSSISQNESEGILRDYASRVPQGEEAFSDREAVACVRSAFKLPPREPAKSKETRESVRLIIKPPAVIEVKPEQRIGAASELSTFLDDVMAGKIFNVPFPWSALTNLTQALLPGSIVSLCGDPGVGKTFWTLQCLQFWKGNDFKPAVFFIEKDRRFHTQRLLAQLEGNGGFCDLAWIAKNHDAVKAAMARHRDYIDDLGGCIASRVGGRITLNDLVTWMEQSVANGSRVLVIDPITAAHAGADRWTADDDFVSAAAQIVTQAKASLILLTHPRKGNIQGKASGHDMAGGAAYNRFVDTVAWLRRPMKPRRVRIATAHGPSILTPDIFLHLQKTRDGKGSGLEIAMKFQGNALSFKEEGIVEKDVAADDAEAA